MAPQRAVSPRQQSAPNGGSRSRWDRGTSPTSIDQMIGNGVLSGGQRLVAARQSLFQLGIRYRAAPATYAATT
jgi:hypothetical protein